MVEKLPMAERLPMVENFPSRKSILAGFVRMFFRYNKVNLEVL